MMKRNKLRKFIVKHFFSKQYMENHKMNYIIDKEQYQQLKKQWASKKTHSSSEIIGYNLLRGFEAKRGFSEIKNPRKIANGQEPWMSFKAAKNSLNWNLTSRYIKEEDRKKTFKENYGLELSPEILQKIEEAIRGQ